MVDHSSKFKFSEPSWRADSHIDPRTGERWDTGASLTCVCGQTIRVGTSGFNGMKHHRNGAKHAQQLKLKIDIAVRAAQVKQRAREAKQRLAAVISSSSPRKRGGSSSSELTQPSDREASPVNVKVAPTPVVTRPPSSKENYASVLKLKAAKSKAKAKAKAKLERLTLAARDNTSKPSSRRVSDPMQEIDFFGD